ncbi:MAG TPA: hypothetical protein VIH86_02370 [Puia sp.]|jgi:hypothetical protein
MKKSFLLFTISIVIIGFSYGQYCSHSMWRVNFFAGAPFNMGASVAYFPTNEHIGFDAGFSVYAASKNYMLNEKNFSDENAKLDAIGKVVYRINQFGTWRHEITVFASFHQKIGASYRLQYLWDNVLIGIEPFISMKETGATLTVNFEL